MQLDKTDNKITITTSYVHFNKYFSNDVMNAGVRVIGIVDSYLII